MSETRELGSRMLRLVAFGVDWLVTILATLLLLGIVPVLESPDPYLYDHGLAIRVLLTGVFAYLILHGWLLIARGQTIGKLLCRLTIVNAESTSRAGILKLVIRSWLFGLVAIGLVYPEVSMIWILYLLNWVFVFGPRRKCLHDYLMKTDVIKYQIDAKTIESR